MIERGNFVVLVDSYMETHETHGNSELIETHGKSETHGSS